jgi:hypothetical protein
MYGRRAKSLACHHPPAWKGGIGMITNLSNTSLRSLVQTPSRRNVLRGLAGAGLSWGALTRPGNTVAKKKRTRKDKKRKRKAAEPNAFGCIAVGDLCQSGSQCCSGICEGKKGKNLQTCQAHGTGTCDQEADGFCQAEDPEKAACNAVPGCDCWRTTAGSQFCGDLNGESGSDCANCRKDADCEALGFPAGSACVPVVGRNCNSSSCEMACLVPCGSETRNRSAKSRSTH